MCKQFPGVSKTTAVVLFYCIFFPPKTICSVQEKTPVEKKQKKNIDF